MRTASRLNSSLYLGAISSLLHCEYRSKETGTKSGQVHLRVFACPDLHEEPTLKDWPGLKSVLAIETIRSIRGRAGTQGEIRYFLASYKDDPEKNGRRNQGPLGHEYERGENITLAPI